MKKFEMLAMSIMFVTMSIIAVGNVYAYTDSDIIAAQVIVPGACTVSLNSTSISFGSVAGGTDTGATNQAVNITNTGNAQATNTTIEGTGWTDGGTNNFAVGNTEYSTSAFTYGAGTALTGSPVTLTGGNLNADASLITYFGVGVPVSQAAATYDQNITITMNC